MAIYKWWHKFVRKRTKPIPESTAVLWKRRLSVAYGLLAWNALGIVLFSAYKGKADWADYYGLKTEEEKAMPPGQSWARTLGLKNLKVYRISGIKVVDEYDVIDGEVHRPPKADEQKNSEQLED